NFIPVQPPPYPYPTPPIIPLISKHRPKPSRETELILIPDLDIDEILGEVQSVIPDIDLDAARQTIVSMNP
ncbi:unnamed protein product, partial [Adineta ricciae]